MFDLEDVESVISSRWAWGIGFVLAVVLTKCCVDVAYADDVVGEISGAGRGRSSEYDLDGPTSTDAYSEAVSDPTRLADRVLTWVAKRYDYTFRFGRGQRRSPGLEWVRTDLVPAAVAAAEGATYPESWPDAETLIAKSWWESRWRPEQVGRFVVRNGRIVRGRGGEVGVMQVKPMICRRYRYLGEDCADTVVNLRIAATILREHLATCGGGRIGYALRFYATGAGCGRPRFGEKRVMLWAEQIRNQVVD